MRRYAIPSLLLVALLLGWLFYRTNDSPSQVPEVSPVIVQKQAASFATHSFDPNAPPSDMPPLSRGESAECDSHFLSSANVRGITKQTDATHGIVTITQVRMTLQLAVNIWLPNEAAQNVIDHEDGHRQISEYYYETADKLAERIASTYINRQIDITGTDLDAASTTMLQQLATTITGEYNNSLNPEPTQLLYDNITDHARNGANSKDAVDHALKNAAIEATNPPATRAN